MILIFGKHLLNMIRVEVASLHFQIILINSHITIIKKQKQQKQSSNCLGQKKNMRNEIPFAVKHYLGKYNLNAAE